MISIKKITQILKILYPDRIRPEDFFEISENIIPQIQKLIDGVDLGYNNAKLIELKHVDAVVDMKWARDHVSEKQAVQPFPDGQTYPPYKVACPTADKEKHDDTRGATIFFNENEHKHQINGDWKENEYGGPIHYKNGDDIFIRGESCTISTSWEYLKEFFDYLPDETVLMRVEGMNKKKLATLFKFYEAHPNFMCHVEKVCNVNVFKKDDVRVNAVTAVSGDVGTMDVDSFNGVSEE